MIFAPQVRTQANWVDVPDYPQLRTP
jgi:hypothetical protein